MIDHQHPEGPTAGLQFQSELFVDGAEAARSMSAAGFEMYGVRWLLP